MQFSYGGFRKRQRLIAISVAYGKSCRACCRRCRWESWWSIWAASGRRH